jgi:hypothetical protein
MIRAAAVDPVRLAADEVAGSVWETNAHRSMMGSDHCGR